MKELEEVDPLPLSSPSNVAKATEPTKKRKRLERGEVLQSLIDDARYDNLYARIPITMHLRPGAHSSHPEWDPDLVDPIFHDDLEGMLKKLAPSPYVCILRTRNV